MVPVEENLGGLHNPSAYTNLDNLNESVMDIPEPFS